MEENKRKHEEVISFASRYSVEWRETI